MRLLGLTGVLLAATTLAQDDSEYIERAAKHREAMGLLVIYLKEGESHLHNESYDKVASCRESLTEYRRAKDALDRAEGYYETMLDPLEHQLARAKNDQERLEIEEEIATERRLKAKELPPIEKQLAEAQAAWARQRSQCYADLAEYERLVATFDKRAPQSQL